MNQLVQTSRYISLTRSFEIAETYAKYYGPLRPAVGNPAYVYEVDIPDSSFAILIDPIQELAQALGTPFALLFYQQDGGQDVILGLADSANYGHVLSRHIRTPGAPIGRGPRISDELHALVRALRDAEVLAHGAIPRSCVVSKHQVV